MDGEEKCDNIFSQIIEKDQMVEAGTKVLKSYFYSVSTPRRYGFFYLCIGKSISVIRL
jgi:hypothetical protein